MDRHDDLAVALTPLIDVLDLLERAFTEARERHQR